VFFFQAEVGIRDWSVTGVQTCALPIFNKAGQGVAAGRADSHRIGRVHEQGTADWHLALELLGDQPISPGRYFPGDGLRWIAGHVDRKKRRVGEGCRCRWWAHDEEREWQ